jgi:hypothetical protein
MSNGQKQVSVVGGDFDADDSLPAACISIAFQPIRCAWCELGGVKDFVVIWRGDSPVRIEVVDDAFINISLGQELRLSSRPLERPSYGE